MVGEAIHGGDEPRARRPGARSARPRAWHRSSSGSARPSTGITWVQRSPVASRRTWAEHQRRAVPAEGVMGDEWQPVFRNVLGQTERTYVSELRDVRNRWAHQEHFSTDDADRALDTIQRLARPVVRGRRGARGRQDAPGPAAGAQFAEQARQTQRKAAVAPVEGQPAGGLKPWREVVTPHPDVRVGPIPAGGVRRRPPPGVAGRGERRVRQAGRVLPAHVPDRRAARAAAERGAAVPQGGRRPGRRAADELRRRQDPLDDRPVPPRRRLPAARAARRRGDARRGRARRAARRRARPCSSGR